MKLGTKNDSFLFLKFVVLDALFTENVQVLFWYIQSYTNI